MPALSPQDVDFVTEARTVVRVEQDVQATPAEVWAVISDTERWPEWFPAAKACKTTSDGTGLGSTRWIHFDLFKVNERFVAWDEPRRWAFTILDMNLPGVAAAVEEARIEAVDNATTRITYSVAAETKAYMKPVMPALRWRLGSLFRAGLGNVQGQVDKLRADGA